MTYDYDTLLNYFRRRAPTDGMYGGLYNLFAGNYFNQPRRHMFKRYTPEEPAFSNMSLRQRRPLPARQKPTSDYQREWVEGYMDNMEGPTRRLTPPTMPPPGIPYRPAPHMKKPLPGSAKRREDAPTRRLIRRGVTPSARRPQEGTISSRLDSLRSQRRKEQRKLSNYRNRRKRISKGHL